MEKERRTAIPFHTRDERLSPSEDHSIAALQISNCGRFIVASCGRELKSWRESPGDRRHFQPSSMEFRGVPSAHVSQLAMFCVCRLCAPEQRDEFISVLEGRRDGTVTICERQTARDYRLLSGDDRRGGDVTHLSWLNFEQRRFMATFGNGLIVVCDATANVHDGNRGLQRIRLKPSDPESLGALEGAGSFFQICPNGLAMAASSDTDSSVLVFGTVIMSDEDFGPVAVSEIFSQGMKLPHPSPVNCVAWCPKIDDRATMAVGQEDGGVALWSVDPTGFGNPEHRCLLWGHPGQAVTHMEFSPDGDLLASAARKRGEPDATINVWCLSSRSVIQTFVRAVGGRGVLALRWLGNEHLVFGFEGGSHFEIADIPTEDALTSFKFASGIRSALLGKGGGDSPTSADFLLSQTTCFQYFVHNFGKILGEQYEKESAEANSEMRLKYSPLMQSLALLASEARLDAVSESLHETAAVPKWSWLSEYCDAFRSLRALTNASPNPKERRKQQHILDRIMSKYMSSRGERKDPVFRSPNQISNRQTVFGSGTGSAASSRPPSSGAASTASSSSNSSSSTASAEGASALSSTLSDLSSSSSSMNATPAPNNWSLEADMELMRWWSESPGDWQSGGRCDAFLFGAGMNGQLAEGSGGDHRSLPALVPSFSQSSQIACGANCTFVIHADGSVSSCGEGSNGRLGLGNSEDHCSLTQISGLRGFSICQLATSVGWDGHSLALATSGEVFSWGDGEDGRLGHGSDDRSRRPRMINALQPQQMLHPQLQQQRGGAAGDARIVFVAAGFRHSAVVTRAGQLLTFGCGEDGRLGHGASLANRRLPEPVMAQSLRGFKIGSVACGGSHTVCTTTDGLVSWAFGNGDHGKLGLGSYESQGLPTEIVSLSGMRVKKVCLGDHFSVFLTSKGVLTCGKEEFTGRPSSLFGARPHNKPAQVLLLPHVAHYKKRICMSLHEFLVISGSSSRLGENRGHFGWVKPYSCTQ